MPGSVLDPSWVRRLRLDDALMEQLSELPGTKHLLDLHDRAVVLSQWRVCQILRPVKSPLSAWFLGCCMWLCEYYM